MREVFEKVKEKLPFALTSAPYTLDFAVCPKTLKCWVVEINNPPPKAGTSLFVWENENDRKIIENGPFEFRLLEAPTKPEVLSTIYEPVLDILTELRKKE
mmetsp:Transcript_38954/g.61687  ORF Transcript_38954/g.61687 Transcript_38954/m.61687 type:complete len:100 (+) Transcript_38954:772-1071(+)